MENVILKDLLAILRFYNDKTDNIAIFRLMSSKLFSIKQQDLARFTRFVSNSNYKSKTKLNYYDALSKLDQIKIEPLMFHFLRKKLDKILYFNNIVELIEAAYEYFHFIDQANIYGDDKLAIDFKHDLLDFIKKGEFITIEDILSYVEKNTYVSNYSDDVKSKIVRDVDYLILRAKMMSDNEEVLKLQKRKQKIIDLSDDLDVSYFVAQIKKDEYEQEKILERQPTFSVTQFNTYDGCPNQYRFSYGFKIPLPQKFFFVFGSVMHKVIEELTKIIQDGKEVSFEFAKQLLVSYWESDGYQSPEQELEYRQKANDIIKMFLEKQEQVDTSLVDIEKTFTIKVQDYKVFGIMDRVDKDDNGDYYVIDYKTSKSKKGPLELQKDIQLLVYYDAAHKLYSKVPKLVSHWYLVHDEIVSVVPTVSDLDMIRQKVLGICKNVVDEKFEPKKCDSCKWCDFKILCKEW